MINTTCASWFCRDDGLIQILSQQGRKIILNRLYSDVWKTVGYGIEKEDLKLTLKSKMSSEQIEFILQDMCEKNIVCNYNDSDIFGFAFS